MGGGRVTWRRRRYWQGWLFGVMYSGVFVCSRCVFVCFLAFAHEEAAVFFCFMSIAGLRLKARAVLGLRHRC